MKDRSSRIGTRLVSLSAVLTPWLLAGSAGAAVSLRQGAAAPAGGAATAAPAPTEARPNTATILIVQGNVQVRLTPEGDVRYRELDARLHSIASTIGVSLPEADIRKTIEIVRRLSDDVKARSERLS